MRESVASGTSLPTWSRRQLEQILGAVADAVTVHDATGTILFANTQAATLLELDSASAIVGASGSEILARFELLDERGLPLDLDELPGRRVFRGEETAEAIVGFRALDSGEERWSRVSAQAIHAPDGTIELAVNTFRDVTAQRIAENRLRFQAELLNDVEVGVVATDLAGEVTYWNKTAETMLGLGAGMHERVNLADLLAPSPTRPEEVAAGPSIEAALLGRRSEGEAILTPPSGAPLPVYVTLSPVHDAESAIVGVTAAMFDISERRRNEMQLRISEERYSTLAESLPLIVWTARPDGTVDHYNKRYYEYVGGARSEPGGWDWTKHIHPQDLPGQVQRWDSAIATGKEYQTEFRLRRHDGIYHWHLGHATALRDDAGELVAWIGTILDIDDRKRAERGLAFLAEASEVLNENLDYEATLASVARLAVPRVSDWCRVDLLDADGHLQTVAIEHSDPAKVELAWEVQRRWPVRLDAPKGLGAVLRSGLPELTEEVPDGALDEAIEDSELREIVRSIGIQSSMIVPLISDGKAIGAISFVVAESGRRFDRADLALAEDLARRATSSIENALLYRRVSQFKGAVDNATDCVFMYDPATLRFTYVNRGAVEQVGYSVDELLRMTPLDLKPDFDEASYRAMIEPLIRGEMDSYSFETVQRRKDGIVFPVDVTLQRIPISPDGLRVIAFVRDVSERVQTQVRLRQLAQAEQTRAAELDGVIRAMGEAVVVFDAEGLVKLTNPAADGLFVGEAPARWADVLDLFAADDVPLERRVDEPHGPVELRLRSRERWIEATTYPVPLNGDADAEGLPAGSAGVTILVMRDVTAQREAAAMREAFVGVLSHELRTPVTTIFGSAKVLERTEARLADEARKGIYADIAAESERLYRLVEDLLVLARFGDIPLSLGDEPVLLQRILPPAVAAEQSRWISTHFVADIPAGLPTVRADPTYVEQVARNLLSNAAKYASKGGDVTMSLRAEGDDVVVTVRDSGPGFPPEEADRLFDLFYRSPQTATQATGAGIGLFVCRRLIEAMGGRIWARNLEPHGAEFGFALKRFVEDE